MRNKDNGMSLENKKEFQEKCYRKYLFKRLLQESDADDLCEAAADGWRNNEGLHDLCRMVAGGWRDNTELHDIVSGMVGNVEPFEAFLEDEYTHNGYMREYLSNSEYSQWVALREEEMDKGLYVPGQYEDPEDPVNRNAKELFDAALKQGLLQEERAIWVCTMVDGKEVWELIPYQEAFNSFARSEDGIESCRQALAESYQEKGEPVSQYELVNYTDIWGNAKDGWEVNNLCVEKRGIFISDDASDKEILDYLVQIGFLTTSDMRIVKLDTSCSPDMIEIYACKGRRPLGRLQKVQG